MARKLQVIGKLLAGDISSEQVKQMVEDYLEETPPVPNITINGEQPDENGNFVINTQADDSNNVVEF